MVVKCIAACTHLSSTVYELLRDIGRKLQLFLPSLAFNAPLAVGGVHIGIPGKSFVLRKLESALAGSEDSLTIGSAVSTQYQRVMGRWTDVQMDRRPDGQTSSLYQERTQYD